MAKFQVRLGSDWADFDPEANRLLEEAILAGEPGLQLQDRGRHYLVDFLGMVQRNTATGREREIRVTFQDESKARDVAVTGAKAAAERAAAAVAAAERERLEHEEAEVRAAAARAAALAHEEEERRQRAEAEASAAAERVAAAAAAAAEEERREREGAERREREEAEAAAAAELAAMERETREREEAEARAAAEAREAAERARREEAAAEEERRRLEALRGDKLTLGVQLDEEASDLWASGRLEEAKRKLVAATALLKWVHRWDDRTKNPKIQALVGQRLELIARRSQQLEEEMCLPPLASSAAEGEAVTPAPEPSVPAAVTGALAEAPGAASTTRTEEAAAAASFLEATRGAFGRRTGCLQGLSGAPGPPSAGELRRQAPIAGVARAIAFMSAQSCL
eukprot:CAMPEP_0171192646 /NCGR_PEP_ID=MMETSP0790-20130122/19976_1 /TAXON_ID=2925 /ORGANISM="Alexandrium catenella, Strain OF101" /LENGTH=397 /DNA_ID=CAMNT_0011657809 /DNA_START=97 /DNA_END=1287 /DNA_ORIENTATION=-